MRRIGDLLDKTLKRFKLEERLRASRALTEWAEAVGPQIAAHTRAVEVAGKALLVQVDHSAWLAQLHLLRPMILERLNARLGEGTIKDLVLRIGSTTPTPRADTSAEATPGAIHESPSPLSPEELGQIDRAIEEVPDPGLRALLRALREKQGPAG